MNEDFEFKVDEFGEWIDDMGPYVPNIKSICLNCGLEETIPDFIYEEMDGKEKTNKHFGYCLYFLELLKQFRIVLLITYKYN